MSPAPLPNKLAPTPGPRCGEVAGYSRHRKLNEKACKPCSRARQDAENERRRKRRDGIMADPDTLERWDYAGPKPSAVEHFLNEIDHLIACGEGWGPICKALNTTPAALARRLTKHGRYHVARDLGIAHHQLEGNHAA